MKFELIHQILVLFLIAIWSVQCKTIQRGWDEFFAASVGVGTAS